MNNYKFLGKYSSLQYHYFKTLTYADSPSDNRQVYHSTVLRSATQCTCIYVFCVDLRTNSDYFPIQH